MRFFYGLLILVWISCGSKKEEIPEIPELTFKLDSLQEKTCIGESCATLRLSWPVAEGGEQARKMNQLIREKLESLVQTGEEVLPLDSAKKNYFRNFKSFKSEFPDSHGGWEIEAEGDVTYQSDSTLSIRFNWMSFLGGAHPNHGKSFMNFNPQTGDYLNTDRLILDEEKLREQVEKKFREFHQVAEGVSIADDGRFFLPETGFFLANAMGFQDGKFWVVYVPYEIGPYAMGYTELEFSLEDLKGIVRW